MQPVKEGSTELVRPHLGLWDTVSLIVGIVIGAGIYETAPLVFQNVSGPGMALGVWVLGGLLSLAGALCYAELATCYPRSGGDYEYLTRAYGRWAGFLFGWCQLAVLMTGSIGMMAYIFADYAVRVWQFGPLSQAFYAAGAVAVLSLLNISGVVFGKRAQNGLTILKIAGLAAIVGCGLFMGQTAAAPTPPNGATESGSLGLAMILVLYTFGGWNDAALVTAEVQDTRRNIPRALVLGTLLITAIYVLVNWAYLSGLGFQQARESRAIAADVLEGALGRSGAILISTLVMVSALGAVNGLIYTGSRIYSTLGEDYRCFSALARRHPWRQSPVWSLAVQGIITLLLILLVGTGTGRDLINGGMGLLGVRGVSWEGHGGFDTLLRCTAPVFWLFFLMTGVSVLVLRRRDPHRARPFKVPLFPVLPLVFCAMCLYMLYSAAVYAGQLAMVGLVPLCAGVVVFAICGWRTRTAGSSAN